MSDTNVDALHTLTTLSGETEAMTRLLAGRGWRTWPGASDHARLSGDMLGRLQQALPWNGMAESMLPAAVQLEKRQRKLMRLISDRMRTIGEDLRQLRLLEKRLETASRITQP